MRAGVIRSLGVPWETLKLEELDDLQARPGEVVVDVAATDLNFADILQCEGKYQVKLDPPFTPGLNTAGTIRAVGEGVDYSVGQRVIGPTARGSGGYAEQARILAEQITVIPQGVDLTLAAAIHVTYGTSWFALHRRGQLQGGETVLVLAAAGGVGSSAVDLARAHGCWVIAAAGGADKVQACRELGADAVVDYIEEDLYERVMTLTQGRGVDVVYDPVGGEYFDIARRLVAWEGRLLVIGFASGTIPSAPANHALVKNYSIVGVHMGGYRQKDPQPFAQCYEELHALLAAGKLNPLIDGVVGFDDLPAALEDLANRKTKGRVIFEPR